MNQQIDLRNVDIVRMAEDDGAQLRGNGTLCGSCPKCGGRDRFAVITNARAGVQLWRCRNCHANGYRLPPNGDPAREMQDAIGYLWHMRGITAWREIFDALRGYGYSGTAKYSSSAPPSAARSKPRPKPITREGIAIPDQLESPPSNEWQDAAAIHAMECMHRLWNSAGARALEYLRTKRMLSDHTIRKFGLGFCDRADKSTGAWRGITIPLQYGGSIWSINVRTAGEPKYIMRTGSRRCVPFNGDALADPKIHNVIICEGEFDAMLCDQHAPEGFAAITFGGKDTAPNYEALLLLRGKRCYCAFDADEAGDAGAIAWQKISTRVRVPHGKDITEFVQAGGDLRQWIVSLTHDDFVQEARAMIEARGMVAIWQNAK